MTTAADTTEAAAAVLAPPAPLSGRARPDLDPEQNPTGERILVGIFVVVPMLALLAAVPLAWGWGLGWRDIVIAISFYYVSGLGISVGFHRYFTHGSFKAVRGLKIALAVAGTLAIEGPVLTWVADHRRHHKYSDKEGDPHSPWRFGNDWKALTKGLSFAHIGWLFDRSRTSQEKFCPDWLPRSATTPIPAVVPRAGGRVAAGAGPDRRAVVVVLGGGPHRVLLGQPGADRVPAPRDLVAQMPLPHVRQGGVRGAGQVTERQLAGDPVVRRVLAQPAPRRPDLRPARRAQGADRHRGAADLGGREARLGF